MQIGLLKLAPFPKESTDPKKLQLLDRAKIAKSSGALQACKKSLYFRIIKGDILSTLNSQQPDACLMTLTIERELGVAASMCAGRPQAIKLATMRAALNILEFSAPTQNQIYTY